MNLKKEIREFSQETTFHGIRIVCGEIFILRRIIWLAILFTMLGLFMCTLVDSMVLYNSYESTISITKDTADTLTLPVLTFCNINIYTHSKVKRYYPEVEEFFKVYYENINEISNVFTNATLIQALKNITLEEYFLKTAATVDEVFVECTDSNLFPLNCSEYVLRKITENGVCFSFNSGQGQVKAINRSFSGMLYQISLTLDVHPEEYFAVSSQGEGFYMMVHNQKVFPQMNTRGFGIGPGQEVFISLKKRISKILPRPYSSQDCVDGDEEIHEDEVDIWPGNSEEECEYRCLLNYFSSNDCWSIPSVYSTNNNPPCSLYSIFQQDSLKMVKMYEKGIECNCSPACSYTGYEQKISRGKFPNQQISGHARAHGWPVMNATEIALRYTQVHVYFEEMQYVVLQQQPSMNLVQLLSNVGGQLGLWIGASLVSIMELLDFIIITVIKHCPSLQNTIKKTTNKVQVLQKTGSF